MLALQSKKGGRQYSQRVWALLCIAVQLLACSNEKACGDGACCQQDWPLVQQGANGCVEGSWTVAPKSSPVTLEGFGATAVVDSKGSLHVAYLRSYPSAGTALFVASEEDSFDARAANKLLYGHATMPTLRTNGPHKLSLVWHQSLDGLGKNFYAERSEAGWVVPALNDALSETGGQEPSLSVGSDGELLVAYTQWLYPGYGTYMMRRAASATAFGPPESSAQMLSQKVQFTNDPRVVQNRRGDVLVTWYQAIESSLLVWHSERFGRDGSFSKPEAADVLSPAETSAGIPFAAIAEDGRACLAWRQDLGKEGEPMSLMLATRDATGQWQARRTLTDTFSKPVERVQSIDVGYSQQGDLFVLWEERQQGQGRVVLAHQDPRGRWLRTGIEPFAISMQGARARKAQLAIGTDSLSVAWLQETSDGRVQAWVRVAALPKTSGEALRWAAPVSFSSEDAQQDVSEVALAVGGKPERVVVIWGQERALRYASLGRKAPAGGSR